MKSTVTFLPEAGMGGDFPYTHLPTPSVTPARARMQEICGTQRRTLRIPGSCKIHLETGNIDPDPACESHCESHNCRLGSRGRARTEDRADERRTWDRLSEVLVTRTEDG
ncbi:hypothetical protein DPEC_G00322510 [Dallia pectoralis]|uniref:Uncharacterized protein n=1 Tax=Dallia pectoralis TaxID=75939 RepID=A0ACC2FAH4_DALPE|nr:hypothetical protein DPEC_G00322510 [Dallia pectoralis]